jgi:CRISPR-associated protein (Cas_Cas02710)
MTTSEFDKYKVDHLFLLIGENPLPNYVAARLLLNNGGTPYIVYTTHTEKSAKRLQTILKNEPTGLKEAQFVALNDYESDAYHIQKEIRDQLNTISNGTIGLNYTGGTKAMAVHTYRVVFSNDRPDTVFSYLDPRKLEMCIDREDGDRIRIKVKPELLQVKLAKLFQIHGLELKADPTKEAQLPDFAAALAEVFKDKDQAKRWHDWYYKVFCQEARKKKSNGELGDWKSKSDLAALSISIEKAPQEIITYFQQNNLVATDARLSLQAVQQKGVFQEIKHFCKYLDGLWLEHHVLEQVKNIAHRNCINNFGLNFEVPIKGTRDGFEFDVAFTRGYQLFALSVSTTSKRDLCKVKLFEAYLRSRQMGGDEARVALVCCSEEPDTLKAELALLDDKKIAVFGREDLMDLSSKIEAWIKQNDKDAR